MKKKLILLNIISLIIFSCSKQETQENLNNNETSIANYTNEEATEEIEGLIQNTKVEWTGFKTTAKTPVSGTFDGVVISKTNNGKTIEEILNGAQVKVAVSSINSELDERDKKLERVLFGNMVETKFIIGDISFEKGNTYITFKLNDVSKKYLVNSTINKNIFTINTTINLLDFKASTALDALNKACEALHKGEDGISKTWSEVEIKGQITFNENFNK